MRLAEIEMEIEIEIEIEIRSIPPRQRESERERGVAVGSCSSLLPPSVSLLHPTPGLSQPLLAALATKESGPFFRVWAIR